MLKLIFSRTRKFHARHYFDEKFYNEYYIDVSSAKVDAFEHYMNYGWKEGRDPSRSFSSLLYKDKYLGPKSGVNPLQHYASLTRRERLSVQQILANESLSIQRKVIEPFFDFVFYRELYNIDESVDALGHYLTHGWVEGNEPNRFFWSEKIVRQHPHIVKMGLCPFYHFVSTYELFAHSTPLSAIFTAGDDEFERVSPQVIKRVIENEFDSAYYLSHYHDVRKAGIDPLQHYIDFGWQEGRNPSEIFWTAHYGEQYARSMRQGTNPFFHYITVGRGQGLLPNPFDYRPMPDPVAPSAAEWNAVVPAANLDTAEVVVIIPVYKGYDETMRAIHSVLFHRQRVEFALIVVDDCGPDPRLRATIKDLASRDVLILIENETNLGFVRSINRAVAACADKNVILLNSDAIPFGNWIDRLLAHARTNHDAATITPLSNNATICSYPQPNANNQLRLEATPAELDAIAKECNAGLSVEIPTAVGFCLFIKANLFAELGAFDAETFGLGYGEENDFSMRARQAGYRNLLAYDVFVYHKGSVSFGSGYQNTERLVEDRLNLKHPNYLSSVRRYNEADPGREARIRLDLFRIARHLCRRAAVFVTHAQGGGIETHVQAAAAHLASEGVEVVLIRISSRSRIDVAFASPSPRSVLTYNCNDLHVLRYHALIEEFLKSLNPIFIHVHSFVGLEWQATRRLMSLIAQCVDKYYYTLHDYSAFCHRNHLMLATGEFCGLASVDICRSCLKADHREEDCVAPEERRRAYATFLEGAEAVFAPSRDIAERAAPLLPGARIEVRPHHETLPIRPLPRLRQRKPLSARRIAVVGAIGPHKGVDILYSLALDARVRQIPIEYVIIGYSSMSAELAKVGVAETGRYSGPADALDLLDEQCIDLVMIPSVWPESYCYTLSIALASGIPPIVFDIGAPAARLRDLDQGLILDIDIIHQPHKINDELANVSLIDLYQRRQAYQSFDYKSMLFNYYGIHAQNYRAKMVQSSRAG